MKYADKSSNHGSVGTSGQIGTADSIANQKKKAIKKNS